MVRPLQSWLIARRALSRNREAIRADNPHMARPFEAVRPADPGYPERLRRLAQPPAVLHVWGRLEPAARMVAIVGTRGARRECTDLAGELAAGLARAGLWIVSGGAIGVDAAAHRGALLSGGSTVAILGSGLERLYPSRNVPLFHEIAARGAVITPFAPHTPPRPGQFPARNRLVAALAEAVVVVEAPPRSGALNTAAHARRLGVPVLAAPHGKGALALLRAGAALAADAAEVLGVLGGQPGRRYHVAPDDPDAREVLQGLGDGEDALQLDTVAERLGWRPSRAAAALLRLELAGCIRSSAGRWYRRAGR